MIQFLRLDNVTILENVKAGQVDGIIPTIPADISPIGWPHPDLDVSEFYLCPVCGYIELGAAPEKCPICSAKQSKFILID
jgi:rubrerythrin